jgi:hypothetical protein
MWIAGQKIAISQIPEENRLKKNFDARRISYGVPKHRGRQTASYLAPILPTHIARASGAAAVGSFPFDPAQAASHNLSIAVLRIGDPEPRGNTVRAIQVDRASPKLPPQL